MMKRWTVLTLVVLLVAAGCGADSATGGSGPTATADAPTAAQSTGELRIASGFLPQTLDPAQVGYTLVERGVGETLVKIGFDQQTELWLAESVEQIDDTNWQVVLRDNVTFWDGSSLTAEDVKTIFENTMETREVAAPYMNPETVITVVDDYTLNFELPEPTGSFVNNLASFHLIIYKEGPDGWLLTGPYQPVRHVPDNEMEREAYQGHWQGPPPIAKIHMRVMADANARLLALQSGEVDMILEVPPALVDDLPDGIDTVISASTRVHHKILNHDRPPFNDPAVREATALAINRDTLNQVVFNGHGITMSSLLPSGIGFSTPDEIQTDTSRAEQILEEADWIAGSDGVRVKDGQRLELLIYSYPSRPEMTAMAVSIQDQLGNLGYDVQVQQVEDIVGQLETLDFDASMFSVNMLPIGDPHYAFHVSLDVYNYGSYSNADLDDLVENIRVETDPVAKDNLLLEALQIMRDDAANIYLMSAPRIVAFTEGFVHGLELHPNDLYLIDTSVSVQ
jgi:peptide/nickel transport system substrate-binding protein